MLGSKILSAAGSLRELDLGVGSGAIRDLPNALIPAFLVPFYLVGHAIVFIQARRAAPARHQLDQAHRATAASAV